MMGAALSTAFYEKARKSEPAPVCVWCRKRPTARASWSTGAEVWVA